VHAESFTPRVTQTTTRKTNEKLESSLAKLYYTKHMGGGRYPREFGKSRVKKGRDINQLGANPMVSRRTEKWGGGGGGEYKEEVAAKLCAPQ